MKRATKRVNARTHKNIRIKFRTYSGLDIVAGALSFFLSLDTGAGGAADCVRAWGTGSGNF
jgi:hypothetical protein